MAETVTCPSCRNTLRIRPVYSEPTITCPRCLAEVANPAVRAGTSAITEERQPGRREAGDTCPNCGEAVNPRWRVCPSCDEWLDEPPVTSRRLPFAERQARQDTTVVGVLFLIMTGLAVAGFLLTAGLFSSQMVASSARASQGNGLQIWMATVIGTALLLVMAVVGSIALVRRPERPDSSGLQRVIVRRIGAAGTVLLAILSLVLAGVVFFLGTCLAMLSSGF